MTGPVYVNRTLNMKKINYIGLDMDHTLIRYNTSAFEALAHKIILDKLVKNHGYPKSVLDLTFEFNLAIRGLVIDKSKGNLLKLSRYSAIRSSYHGLHRIQYSKQKKIYKSTYIDLSDPNYDPVDTSFSIAFATLYAQLVDLKDGREFENLPDYETIAINIKTALDWAHRDGSLKNVVQENLDTYIVKDPDVVAGIERYKKHGKKIFILTNSDYKYSKVLLDYAINPFLKEHKTWSDLFEFTITLAQKPRFFHDLLSFLKVNPADGSLTNAEEPVKDGIYQGGCADMLTSDLNLDPDEVLYIGDHIYGDVVRLKKDCAWRTALVVEELTEEVNKNLEAKVFEDKINSLMDKKRPLETHIDDLICEKIEQSSKDVDDEIHQLIESIQEVDKEISILIKEVSKIHNPYWGEIMRVGIEESFFAYQVERFACIYMAKLSDLFTVSPRTYFRSNKRAMAHDLK